MIWIYILLSLVEFILAYITYSAVSFDVTSGAKIFEDYVLCGGGYTSCSEKFIKENEHSSYYYIPTKDRYYIRNENLFFEQYNFKLNKFCKIVMVVSLFLFVLPFCGPHGENALGESLFVCAGALCLTLLSFSACSNTEKKCKEQYEVFRKLKESQLPNIPLHVLRQESVDEIKKIIYRDSYEYAQRWLTKEEKELMKVLKK